MTKFLWSARMMRNAAAHNNCLLNSLKTPYSRKISINWAVANFISKIPGINKDSRTKRMSNPVIHDFLVTLYLFDQVVSSKMLKSYTFKELKELVTIRFVRHKEYFSKNEVVPSNVDFLRKIVDFYCQERV